MLVKRRIVTREVRVTRTGPVPVWEKFGDDALMNGTADFEESTPSPDGQRDYPDIPWYMFH